MRADAGRAGDPGTFTLEAFHSDDQAMRGCLELARVAARTDLPILILGESGTGKTLLARAIHNSSRRVGGSFVSFNSAALSDTLLDSQLFGHEKGAFTGAEKRVKGKFELADKGTLFIDEIADMSSAAQAKILRAVEYGEFERLGSESLQVADVRLMTATHLPLRRFLETEQFRKDLFYRISGIRVTIPPLRERPADLRSLVAGEVELACREQQKTIVGLETRAADLLFSYHWPGNLRELKRVVHAAVALSPEKVLTAESILLEGLETSEPAASLETHDIATPSTSVRGREGSSTQAGAAGRLPTTGRRERDDDSLEGDLSLRTAELRHIRRVLERMGGNKRAAARVLGLSRSTLDRKLTAFLD
jgi:transcriptional regulator with PAS, ATPase and Fis domain